MKKLFLLTALILFSVFTVTLIQACSPTGPCPSWDPNCICPTQPQPMACQPGSFICESGTTFTLTCSDQGQYYRDLVDKQCGYSKPVIEETEATSGRTKNACCKTLFLGACFSYDDNCDRSKVFCYTRKDCGALVNPFFSGINTAIKGNYDCVDHKCISSELYLVQQKEGSIQQVGNGITYTTVTNPGYTGNQTTQQQIDQANKVDIKDFLSGLKTGDWLGNWIYWVYIILIIVLLWVFTPYLRAILRAFGIVV
jgi:hypothetical protein